MLAFPFYPILHFWMFKQLGIPIMNFQFSFIGKCPIPSLFLKDIIHGHKFLGQWLFLSPRILDVISSTSRQCFWGEVSSNCIIHCVLIIFFSPFLFSKFTLCISEVHDMSRPESLSLLSTWVIFELSSKD